MECDDDDIMQVMSDMQGGANGKNPIVMEAKAVYKQLKTLCGTLKNSHDDDSGKQLLVNSVFGGLLHFYSLSTSRSSFWSIFGLDG